ncbi:hypothetical protein EDB80DRAFT_881742 [Ilyonectria destructans]|nr:hypothetical protein EDB80DRAFT_881742 [Ilyonectria destructans]
MHFTSATPSIILTFISLETAAHNTDKQNGYMSGNELSQTALLQLADTTADRFSLLANDGDFAFGFNQQQADPGKGDAYSETISLS